MVENNFFGRRNYYIRKVFLCSFFHGEDSKEMLYFFLLVADPDFTPTQCVTVHSGWGSEILICNYK